MQVTTWIFQLSGNTFKIQTLRKCMKEIIERREREMTGSVSSVGLMGGKFTVWLCAPAVTGRSPGPAVAAWTHLSRPTLSVLGPLGDNHTPLLLFGAGAHASRSAMNPLFLPVYVAAATSKSHWNIREVLQRPRRILLPRLAPCNRLQAGLTSCTRYLLTLPFHAFQSKGHAFALRHRKFNWFICCTFAI